MELKSQDLEVLCLKAIDAAKKAGRLINEYSNTTIEVKNKEAADSLASQVVTEVDIKAQELILTTLAPTLQSYNLALLTEESTDDMSRFEKDHFWCIDPMDGTLCFTEKIPGYAVSIALVRKDGEPLVGVVYDPLTDTLFHSMKDMGTFKNKLPWLPETNNFSSSEFTLFIDRSFVLHKHYEQIMDSIKDLVKRLGFSNLRIEKLAGAVLNACWVMDRAPGCYFKLPKPQPGGGSLWDFAATACIAKEARAYACSFDGSPLDLNRENSTFMNHKGALYASNEEIARKFRTTLISFC